MRNKEYIKETNRRAAAEETLNNLFNTLGTEIPGLRKILSGTTIPLDKFRRVEKMFPILNTDWSEQLECGYITPLGLMNAILRLLHGRTLHAIIDPQTADEQIIGAELADWHEGIQTYNLDVDTLESWLLLQNFKKVPADAEKEPEEADFFYREVGLFIEVVAINYGTDHETLHYWTADGVHLEDTGLGKPWFIPQNAVMYSLELLKIRNNAIHTISALNTELNIHADSFLPRVLDIIPVNCRPDEAENLLRKKEIIHIAVDYVTHQGIDRTAIIMLQIINDKNPEEPEISLTYLYTPVNHTASERSLIQQAISRWIENGTIS